LAEVIKCGTVESLGFENAVPKKVAGCLVVVVLVAVVLVVVVVVKFFNEL